MTTEERSERGIVRLNCGLHMPAVGIGTSHNQGGTSQEAVLHALRSGVRLVDTASRYGTEKIVGNALRMFRSKCEGEAVPKIFTTSKLWPGDVTGAGSGAVKRAIGRTLSSLGEKKISLYLVHWPGIGSDRGGDPDQARLNVWREMHEVLKSGACDAIGVSNFLERHIEPLLRFDGGCVVPAVNQIEFNPLQNPEKLRLYCAKHKIAIQGYAPFAKGACFRKREICDVADALKVSPSQLLIRWAVLHRGIACVWKSRNRDHISDNAAALNVRVPASSEAKAMIALSNMHENLRVTWNPTRVP